MIPVAKPYMPSREKLDKYLDGIFERAWLANNGQLVQELTTRLEQYLGVENLLLVANGTLALQIAYRALGLHCDQSRQSIEAITTPFTFIATASSLKWEGIKPVFSDIDPHSWCLAPATIDRAVTPHTSAIVPVHVFGNACDVDSIDSIARHHNLKVIYDASHAFAVQHKGRSLLNYGDAATLSFHATKLFHTGEGGAIVFRHREDLERARQMINFGITSPSSIEALGINAKMNELQAAIGLCVLDEMEENIRSRRQIWDYYRNSLEGRLQLQYISEHVHYNHAYFPVLFDSEARATDIVARLFDSSIQARRYFHPSLNTVRCLGKHAKQPVSEDISSRIVCLPIYPGLPDDYQKETIRIVREAISP